MKKLAIVSSYNELCGNATFSEALRRGFSRFFDVTMVAVPVILFGQVSAQARRLSCQVVSDMVLSLKAADYANIQFEKGLYGRSCIDVYKRFVKLASACPRTIVTLHRYDLKKSLLTPENLKEIVNEFSLKTVWRIFRENKDAKLYEKIIKFCEKNNVGVVVHTPREKRLISSITPGLKIWDHPISFLNQDMREAYKKNLNRKLFLEKYGFSESDIIIGIFGFISEYKGHDVLIDALKKLPKNYKLAIFGSDHPYGIKAGIRMNKYIGQLSSQIERLFYCQPGRVVFCGALDDSAFISSLLLCDFNVLPYFETNQSGSGVASLALETGRKVIMSQNFAFIELAKYAKNAFKMFSIGSYLELADCILNFKDTLDDGLSEYFKKYNLDTQIDFYIKNFALLDQSI